MKRGGGRGGRTRSIAALGGMHSISVGGGALRSHLPPHLATWHDCLAPLPPRRLRNASLATDSYQTDCPHLPCVRRQRFPALAPAAAPHHPVHWLWRLQRGTCWCRVGAAQATRKHRLVHAPQQLVIARPRRDRPIRCFQSPARHWARVLSHSQPLAAAAVVAAVAVPSVAASDAPWTPSLAPPAAARPAAAAARGPVHGAPPPAGAAPRESETRTANAWIKCGGQTGGPGHSGERTSATSLSSRWRSMLHSARAADRSLR